MISVPSRPLPEPDSALVVHRLYAKPGVQVVPLEVAWSILHNLRGWMGVLYNCALAHPSWYPEAVRILYRDIHITNRSRYDALRKVLLHRNVAAHHTFTHTEAINVVFTTDHDDCVPDVLSALASVAFPKLRSMHFSTHPPPRDHKLPHPPSGSSQRPPWSIPFSFSNPFSSVTSLSFTGQIFRTLRELVRTICAFPQLQDLELQGCDFNTRMHIDVSSHQ